MAEQSGELAKVNPGLAAKGIIEFDTVDAAAEAALDAAVEGVAEIAKGRDSARLA